MAKLVGMPFSEETITDTILMDLATQHPQELKIFPLNKRMEGKVGADWEWCFYNKNKTKFQQLLVQAKLLDDNEKNYAHIDRYIGSTGIRQIDRLLDSADIRAVPAIYVFYNHLIDISTIPINCASFQCEECWGCSVALAKTIRALLPSKDFDTIKQFSKPWVCLLCKGLSSESDAPSRVLASLHQLRGQTLAQFRELGIPFKDEIVLPDKPSNDPPRYFHQLLEARGDMRERVLKEIADKNPELDGIILAADGNESEG